MKWMNVFQACAAAGTLAAGLLVAANGYADNCQAVENWGFTSPDGGVCSGMGVFQSGNEGLSNAWIAANLQDSTDPADTPGSAEITGLDSNQHAISGCTVTDDTVDGNSVSKDTGCSSGVFVKWLVYFTPI